MLRFQKFYIIESFIILILQEVGTRIANEENMCEHHMSQNKYLRGT